jgi:acyl-CoA thioesterase FadM
VIDAHLKFHQAARLGQQLAIETKLESFQDSRVWLYQQIRLKDSGEILVSAEVLSVCIDTRAHRATNLPDELCQALSRKKEGQEWAEAGLRMPAAKPQKAGVAA